MGAVPPVLLGVAAIMVAIILDAFAYKRLSSGDTKTPVKVAFFALLTNAGLGFVLMIPLQHGGLALATSLAAGLNFSLLVFFLRVLVGNSIYFKMVLGCYCSVCKVLRCVGMIWRVSA
jgi:peptidoglycan biosynthesis protein MviN/MurJ (putative lipid II flippase)